MPACITGLCNSSLAVLELSGIPDILLQLELSIGLSEVVLKSRPQTIGTGYML